MAYVSLPRRVVTLLTISTMLVACSAEGLVPPATIDGETRVGAITPMRQQTRQQNYPSAARQSVNTGQSNDYLNTPNLAATGGGYSEPQILRAPSHQPLPGIDSNEAMAVTNAPHAGSSGSQDGVNMDAMLGVEPVRGLAEDQQMDIAEGASNQPVVDGIGTDNPRQMPGAAPQSPAVWDGQATVEPPRTRAPQQPVQQVAMLRPQNPMQSQQSTMPPGMMPQSEISCRAELRRLGVAFRDVARIADGPTCGIDYPVELSGLSGGVTIKPAVKINCQLTLAFAKWVKYELVPSSRFRYMSGVGRITPMGGYSCRKMNSRSNNPWSEHARGNAIDIGTITLNNGKEIDVRKKGFFAFREKGLLKAVRTDSCKYFSTVLGPGSDPDHWNHFHFDLRTRKSGYRHCG
jgi:hypothetical protein